MRRIFISDPPSQRSSYCRCPNLQQASLSKTELVYSSTHNTTLQHTCRCYISTVNNSYIQTNSRKLLCTVSRITSWEFLQCIYLLPDVYSSRRTVYFFSNYPVDITLYIYCYFLSRSSLKDMAGKRSELCGLIWEDSMFLPTSTAMMSECIFLLGNNQEYYFRNRQSYCFCVIFVF